MPTDHHDLSMPARNSLDWDVPLNVNFQTIDDLLWIRDTAANRTNYTPKAGSLFVATDTQDVHMGDGAQWQPFGSLSGGGSATDTRTNISENGAPVTTNVADINFTGSGVAVGNDGDGSVTATITDTDTIYTDADAHDAVGGIVTGELVYDSAAPSISIADGSFVSPGDALTLLSSGAASTGEVPTADGVGGIAWEAGGTGGYTDEAAQDAIGQNVGDGLAYDDTTGAISVDGYPAADGLTISGWTVVDAVEAGADNTGVADAGAAINAAISGDTILILPAGTYQLANPINKTNLEKLAIIGKGDVTLKVPAGDLSGAIIAGSSTMPIGDLHIENLTIDYTATGAGGDAITAAANNALIKDVDLVGGQASGEATFTITATDPDGLFELNHVRAADGVETGFALGGTGHGPPCFFVHIDTVGEVKFTDCHAHGWPNNGIYASSSSGPVTIDGGHFKNNNISNVRVGDGGTIRNVRIEVDGQANYGGSGVAINQRGIWLHNGDVSVENCDIEFTGGASGDCIDTRPDVTRATISETRINSDVSNEMLYTAATTGVQNGYVVSDVSLTGVGSSTGATAAVALNRDDAVFHNLHADLPNRTRVVSSNGNNTEYLGGDLAAGGAEIVFATGVTGARVMNTRLANGISGDTSGLIDATVNSSTVATHATDVANLSSGGAADGLLATADGVGGVLWQAPDAVAGYTDEEAQDAVGLNVGTGLAYDDTTGSISVSGLTAADVGAIADATGAVTTNHLATDSVTATEILAGSVGAAEIATAAVGETELANLSVSTGKLADGAVTAAKATLGASDVGALPIGGGTLTGSLTIDTTGPGLAYTDSGVYKGTLEHKSGNLQYWNGPANAFGFVLNETTNVMNFPGGVQSGGTAVTRGDYVIQKNGTDGVGIINFKTV